MKSIGDSVPTMAKWVELRQECKKLKEKETKKEELNESRSRKMYWL